jgi:hypothetical protein
MIPKITTGRSITGAMRYVLGEGRERETGELKTLAQGEPSRVAWISGTGFGFEIRTEAQADLARRCMEFDALNQGRRTRKCDQVCVHLSLSWKPAETPSQAEMEAAAHGVLNALGMKNARAVFVAHHHETHAHVHIVACRINPETNRAFDLTRCWTTLANWARAYDGIERVDAA